MASGVTASLFGKNKHKNPQAPHLHGRMAVFPPLPSFCGVYDTILHQLCNTGTGSLHIPHNGHHSEPGNQSFLESTFK